MLPLATHRYRYAKAQCAAPLVNWAVFQLPVTQSLSTFKLSHSAMLIGFRTHDVGFGYDKDWWSMRRMKKLRMLPLQEVLEMRNHASSAFIISSTPSRRRMSTV